MKYKLKCVNLRIEIGVLTGAKENKNPREKI
jgi:hypothetical protein